MRGVHSLVDTGRRRGVVLNGGGTVTMELRDYQRASVDELIGQLDPKGRSRVIYQLPTGGGKTAIGGEVVARYLDATDDARSTWVTHRRELELQSSGRLVSEHGVERHRVVVASPIRAHNMFKRGVIGNEGDLLIVDEAHHSVARSWSSLVKQWPGPALGLTATPWRFCLLYTSPSPRD